MYYRGDGSLEINVGNVRTLKELHNLLFEAFQFPDSYGNNWDAFVECIRDVEVPPIIQIKDFEKLRSRLPREAELLSRCLEDFVRSNESPVTIRFS